MFHAFIIYVSCLFLRGGWWGVFSDVISWEDCVMFNDGVTDKFRRIW